MTEQIQVRECGHCHLEKLHRLELTSGSWDAPDYPTCQRTPLQQLGTNRILYHYIAAQTFTEPPPCFTVATRLPWVFSKRQLFLMYGTVWWINHLTI
jgi:hypothetical protein